MASPKLDITDDISPSKPPRHKKAKTAGMADAAMAGIHETLDQYVNNSEQDMTRERSSITDNNLEERIKELEEKVTKLSLNQSRIESEISEEGSIRSDIIDNKSALDDALSEISKLREKDEWQQEVIMRLSAVVKKSNEKIKSLREDLDKVRDRELSEKVLIHNIPEGLDQNLGKEVSSALKKKGIPFADEIKWKQLYRLGKMRADGKNRTIVATPESCEYLDALVRFKFTKLEKTEGIWISRMYTEKVRETRRQLGKIGADFKKKHKDANVSLKFTTLTINGQRVTPTIHPPEPTSMILLDEEDKKLLQKVDFYTSNTEHILGSTFTARTTNVNTLQDVRIAYKALLLNPSCLASTHNIAGYVLPNGSNGYADDGDYGIGRAIVETMIDEKAMGKAVFITRQFGGQLLGIDRFRVAKRLTQEICSKPNELRDLVTFIGSGGKVLHPQHGLPQTTTVKDIVPKDAEKKTSNAQPTTSEIQENPDMDVDIATDIVNKDIQ